MHREGQFGWATGDWVNEKDGGRDFHYGWDVVGWIGASRRGRLLDDELRCRPPLEGVVQHVGKDEHNELCVVVRHSPATARLRRFTFFGDLEQVYVKPGQKVSTRTALGLPLRFKRHRFFHFAMGYEVYSGGKRDDIYVDPREVLGCEFRTWSK